MRMKWMLTALIAAGLAAPMGAAAQGQIDIGVSGYENIAQSSSGNGTSQKPSNAPGGAVEVRYLLKPLVGAELSYSFNKLDTTFAPNGTSCAYVCNEPTTSLSIKDSNLALDYVASGKFGNLRPFVLGGVGFNITAAAASTYGVREVIRAAYNVGGGADFALGSHLGIRAQVRDYFIKAQNNSSLYPATGVTTNNIVPMGGVYYRF